MQSEHVLFFNSHLRNFIIFLLSQKKYIFSFSVLLCLICNKNGEKEASGSKFISSCRLPPACCEGTGSWGPAADRPAPRRSILTNPCRSTLPPPLLGHIKEEYKKTKNIAERRVRNTSLSFLLQVSSMPVLISKDDVLVTRRLGYFSFKQPENSK